MLLERNLAMAVNINEIIRKLSAARRKKVLSRAAEIIAEELSARNPPNSKIPQSRTQRRRRGTG
jgi:hypothetical protein